MIKSNRGQLSIFMGITLVIVMGMLAFIINIGLFVKAKINLQNATDAAAFAGAATQARQLTNIAYANWELRNTYKEWMFKYYILGQLGLMPYNLKNVSGNGNVNFILNSPPIAGYSAYDKYNVPSICVHNNSKTNICPIFALPGIPRFPAIGVAGISEIHEAFVNKLVEEKGKDCTRRSQANFLTALTWAYGSGMDAMPEAPLVATNRPGAWPESLELAFRIRNLEMIMNRPPVADLTLKNIQQFQGQAEEIGLNERPMKAFWSAYRNLGGGVYKDNNVGTGAVEELSFNLKMTELAPQSFKADVLSVSGFLINPSFGYPGAGVSALEKHYVDLQLAPVNLATMFSTFVDLAEENTALGVKAEATCGISKSALPVPGYIMGFNKNPEVITYYAVKTETKFMGLFFPIGSGDSEDGIKLTAYAAAKPFGGRIGPKLFQFKDGGKVVASREDKNRRSAPYLSGIKINAPYSPGMPIPSNKDFWVDSINNVIGGIPGQTRGPFFSIPNMVYDYTTEGDMLLQQQSAGEVQVIEAIAPPPAKPTEKLGLYHMPQISALKDSLGVVNPGDSMSGDEVTKAIMRARRPTKYDAVNYLVPDFREVSNKNNAAPFIRRLNPISNVGFTYSLFAPLVGPNLLYKTNNDVESTIRTYMKANDDAVKTYLQGMLDVANTVYRLSTSGASQGDTKEAAKSIHANADGATGAETPPPLNEADCKSDMASKFNHFFREEKTACGMVPLFKLMTDFIANHSEKTGNLDRSLYYVGMYYNDPSSPLTLPPEKLMSAYYPGVRQGTLAGDPGMAEHPLGLQGFDSYSTRRNYYSTKFFHMAKIIDSPPGITSFTRGRLDYQVQPALQEVFSDASASDLTNLQIKNFLKYDETTGINNSYFLDF